MKTPTDPLMECATAGTALPDYLQPSEEGTDDWRLVVGTEWRQTVEGLAHQYGIHHEVAFATLMAAVGHALGDSVGVDSGWGRVVPPFSVMILTPERDPLWNVVPQKALMNGLLTAAHERQTAIYGGRAIPEEDSSTIVRGALRESVLAPFRASSIDRHIMLSTPARGLARSLRELNPVGRLWLEETLLASRELIRQPGPERLARGCFFWHAMIKQAAALFRNNHWLAGVPFLLVRTDEPGFPQMVPDPTFCEQLNKTFTRLAVERLVRAGTPHRAPLSAECARPLMRFLDGAQSEEAEGDHPHPARWVVELAMRLCLIVSRLRDQHEWDPLQVANCLEVAKRMTRRHLEVLSAYLDVWAAERTATADLTDRERQAYLKIVEAGRLRRADLRKGFHHMTARERDEVVVRLLALGLITQDGEHLMQSEAK